MSEQKSSPPIAKLGLILAALCGLGIPLSAYGYRMEMWNHKMVFKAITWAAYGGIGAGVVSIIGFVMARNAKNGVGLAVIGFVISAIVVFAPYSYGKLLDRKLHPKIHDISTDTANPPTFVTIVKIRKAAKKKNPKRAKNKTKYAGEKVANLQRKYHPNLKTIKFKQPADKVFNKSLELVKEMGWIIAATVPGEGRIEATATTFWLGFKDDVVLRIKQAGDETHLDMRSASRFGKGDRGENARRIKAFLAQLKDKLG